jgi:spore maturation protein CgeB
VRALKILYVAGLSLADSSQYRAWALERLGHTVIPLNFYEYESGNSLVRKVVHRLVAGPGVARFNRDILAAAEREKPEVFWADKLLWLWPETLDRLRAMGVVTVSYMIDNPFGTRQDPGWRMYLKDIPGFDLHVVQRDSNVADYMQRGAREVIKVQTAYEPTVHYPPPDGWGDERRDRGVSFIGTAYDDRAEVLTRLWQEFGFPVVISGDKQWRRRLEPDALAALYTGGELYMQAYREGIWRSKINLSFITHANQDEFVHKSFEIAGCGGFLLAERSAGHSARFVEDEEAVFFTGIEELAEKVRRYLPDESARERIAAAGRARAARDGYDNDAQVGKIVERLGEILVDGAGGFLLRDEV